MDAIGALDLFIEERMTNQWQAANPADGPQGQAIPAFLAYPALLAVVPAILLAIPSWGIRNYASDEKAFKALMAYPTFYGCEDYVREEGRHIDDVNTFCFARTSMREIQGLDSSSLGYRALKKKFPAPAVQGELEQALQKALANEFSIAKTKNTVDAYRKFLHDAPDARQAPDAKKAIHAAYQRALANYGKKTNTSDASIIPFMAELVDQLEKNDSPPVAVSFERVPTKSLDVADRLLAGDADSGGLSGLGYGGFAKASTFFDATHAKHREDTLVTQLQKAFTGVFPEDMLRFAKDDGRKAKARRSVLDMSAVELEDELIARNGSKYFDKSHFGSRTGTSGYSSGYSTSTAPKTEKTDTATITNASPTMHVKYTVDWSGTTYKDSTSGRRFVGIIINFDVAMAVDSAASKHASVCPPTKAAPLATGSFCPIGFKLEVRPPASFEVKYSKFMDNKLIGSGNPSDSLVYEVMAAQAYEQLSTKLHDAFFATEADLRAKAKADAAATGASSDDDDDDEEADAPPPRRLPGSRRRGGSTRASEKPRGKHRNERQHDERVAAGPEEDRMDRGRGQNRGRGRHSRGSRASERRAPPTPGSRPSPKPAPGRQRQWPTEGRDASRSPIAAPARRAPARAHIEGRWSPQFRECSSRARDGNGAPPARRRMGTDEEVPAAVHAHERAAVHLPAISRRPGRDEGEREDRSDCGPEEPKLLRSHEHEQPPKGARCAGDPEARPLRCGAARLPAGEDDGEERGGHPFGHQRRRVRQQRRMKRNKEAGNERRPTAHFPSGDAVGADCSDRPEEAGDRHRDGRRRPKQRVGAGQERRVTDRVVSGRRDGAVVPQPGVSCTDRYTTCETVLRRRVTREAAAPTVPLLGESAVLRQACHERAGRSQEAEALEGSSDLGKRQTDDGRVTPLDGPHVARKTPLDRVAARLVETFSALRVGEDLRLGHRPHKHSRFHGFYVVDHAAHGRNRKPRRHGMGRTFELTNHRRVLGGIGRLTEEAVAGNDHGRIGHKNSSFLRNLCAVAQGGAGRCELVGDDTCKIHACRFAGEDRLVDGDDAYDVAYPKLFDEGASSRRAAAKNEGD
ncbi:hypothetical protein OUZ56_032314 [Daphnia magna]|uniref:Uncharacterized protein n=1 Tax=Daphnia magna TaxID=35525 RepID=A0ABR0B8I6_9CRUS|nr:hypothetical protein OUZ56_032314 [Daphnia magna]